MSAFLAQCGYKVEAKVTFVTKLTKGTHELSPYFHIPAGQLGAYYAVVTKK